MLGNVSGPTADSFAISLTNDSAGLTFKDAEVGPVTLVGGGGDVGGTVKLGYFDNTGTLVAGSLNATDGQPVNATSGAGLLSLDGTVGPLSAVDGLVQVGQPDQAGTLAVSGDLSLDQDSALLMSINAAGTASGSDYSELSASGTVDLGAATLTLEDGEVPGSNACELLTPGDVDALITTTPGGLMGQFSGIPPDGPPVPLVCPGSGGTPPTATIGYDYAAGIVTATIATAGTAGAATTTTLSAAPSNPVTNQPVALTAAVSAGAATPTGTVEFFDELSGNTTPIAGCDAQPVTEVQPVPPSGPSYTATCQTSFAASESPSLSAVFSPADGSDGAASSASGIALSVAPAATTTTLALAPTTVGPAQPTTMTATVTPSQAGSTEPSGTVTFLVDGQPVPAGDGGPGCTSVPVVAGSSAATAQCQLEFETLSGSSTHAITATYSADANFTASTSPPQTLSTVGQASLPAKPRQPSKLCQPQVGRASVSVIKIDVVVTCKGTKGQRATLSLKLSARERRKLRSTKGHPRKSTPKTSVVGTRTLTLDANEGETVHVTLDAGAIDALVKARKLRITFTATEKAADGATKLSTQELTFTSHCGSTWAALKICQARSA